jgi:hypothetical protein
VLTRSLTLAVLLVAALALTSCARNGSGGPAGVRSPTFQYVKAEEGGCGDVYFYKGTADKTEVLWVSADKKKLRLPDQGSKTFDLAAAPDGLIVAVDLWPKAPRFRAYCNDISPDVRRDATWKAKKGKVTITVSEPPDKEGRGKHKAGVRLEDVLFEDDAGHQATLKEEAITDVLVGWYAG